MEENKNNVETNNISAIESQNTKDEVNQPVINDTIKQEEVKKGSKLKTFGVILLFILLFVVVFFLPEISDFINSRNQDAVVITPNETNETYQTRICSFKRETEDLITTIELTFYYQNNALKKEVLMNEIKTINNNDEDRKLYNMHLSCQNFKEQIEKLNGIKQYCTLKDNTETIKQEIDYSKLESIDLEQNIGELEGFYPEFNLNQDKKMIETMLTKIGYTCKNFN